MAKEIVVIGGGIVGMLIAELAGRSANTVLIDPGPGGATMRSFGP